MSKRVAVLKTQFREDLEFWVKTDRKVALRIFKIMEDILRDPFHGLGKPEPLKYELSGVWSRRITRDHRVVYKVSEKWIEFLQARYHY